MEECLEKLYPKETIAVTVVLLILLGIEVSEQFISPPIEDFLQIKDLFPLIMTFVPVAMTIAIINSLRGMRKENRKLLTCPFTLWASTLEENKNFAHLLTELSSDKCRATQLFQKVPPKTNNSYEDMAEPTIRKRIAFLRIITIESIDKIDYARYLYNLQQQYNTFKVKVLNIKAKLSTKSR